MARIPLEQRAAPEARRHRADALLAGRRGLAAALLVAALAFALRAWGVSVGLPYVDHPDEPNPVGYVIEMLRSGDLNPHEFQKPHLYVYMLLAVVAAHYALGLQSGLYQSLDQMTVTTHVYTTLPGFFLAGRMLTVTLGALSTLAVYAIGRRVWGAAAGLLGALLLALLQFHAQHSQYVTTDVASGLLVLLTFGAALGVARDGRPRDYLLAGLLAGLAASTKYNAAAAAAMVAAAHLARLAPRDAAGGRARAAQLVGLPLLAALAAAVGFLAGTPFALLSWPEFVAGVAGQVAAYNDGSQGDASGAWNLRAYASFCWRELTPTGCLATIAGLVLLLRRRPAVALVWLGFALPYLALLLAQQSHFMRNMVPLLAMAAIPAGVAGAALVERLGRPAPYPGAARALVAAGAVALLLVPAGLETLRYAERLGRGDTRTQLMGWIATAVPPGARIAAELRPLPGPLESRWAEVEWLPEHDLAWYRRQGYAYLIGSSERWRQWAVPDAHAALAGDQPLASFGGADPRQMFGPHLVVYATGLTAADAPVPVGAAFGGVRLAGVALGLPEDGAPHLGLQPATAYRPGDVLALRTFWQVEEALDRDYYIFVHILDAAGGRPAQRDAPPWQGRFPTSSWRPGTLVVDVNDVPLPAGMPPGEYRVVVGMIEPESGARPGGEPVEVARVRVE